MKKILISTIAIMALSSASFARVIYHPGGGSPVIVQEPGTVVQQPNVVVQQPAPVRATTYTKPPVNPYYQVSYAGVGIVSEDIEDYYDTGVAMEAVIGTRNYSNFGLEMKLSKTVSEALTETYSDDYKFDLTNVSLFGTYNFFIAPQFIVMPKIGVSYSVMELSRDGYTDSESDIEVDVSAAYGVDFKFDMPEDLTFYIGITGHTPEYDGESLNLAQYAFGIQKRF